MPTNPRPPTNYKNIGLEIPSVNMALEYCTLNIFWLIVWGEYFVVFPSIREHTILAQQEARPTYAVRGGIPNHWERMSKTISYPYLFVTHNRFLLLCLRTIDAVAYTLLTRRRILLVYWSVVCVSFTYTSA